VISDVVTLSEAERAALQRRTLWVLFSGTIPAGAATSGAFAAAATLGEQLTGSDALGTLAAACMTVGGALATVPISRLSSSRGRRPALRAAWAISGVGAFVAFIAAITSTYALLLPGLIAFGAGNAGTLSARFAAADLATENQRARAIGMLVWGGTFGSVFGPLLALGPASAAARALGLRELAGPFIMATLLFAVASLAMDRGLRPDPLVAAGGLGRAGDRATLAESFAKLWQRPPARLAVGAMVVGQFVMAGIMVATPLHMKDGGQEIRIVGFVISVHIIGMYMFAPIVGRIVDAMGPRLTIAAGGFILLVGAELSGRTVAEDRTGIFVGLFLVGLGWSFGIIAASSLLTATFSPTERVVVQGAADLAMTAAGAAAGLLSGVVLALLGFRDLGRYGAIVAGTLAVVALASLVSERRLKPVA